MLRCVEAEAVFVPEIFYGKKSSYEAPTVGPGTMVQGRDAVAHGLG